MHDTTWYPSIQRIITNWILWKWYSKCKRKKLIHDVMRQYNFIKNNVTSSIFVTHLTQRTLKRFCQYIRYHITHWQIIETNFFIHYSIRNEEISHGNVPCFWTKIIFSFFQFDATQNAITRSQLISLCYGATAKCLEIFPGTRKILEV